MKTFQIKLNGEVIGTEVVAKFMNLSAVILLCVRLGYPVGVEVEQIKSRK